MWLWTEDVFEIEDSSGVARSGGNSRVDSGSYGFFGEKILVAWTRVIILMKVKF